MKSSRFFYPFLTVVLALGSLALLPLARGAGATNPAPAAKGKTATGATNSANSIMPIPSSVFDLTASPLKNPFFPNSQRHPVSQSATNAAPAISASSFQLMGLSGSSNSRLAMINHRTFGEGEAVEVMTVGGQKVTIRVLQIKDSTVLIRVTTPPQPDLIELSLSKRAQ